MPKMHVMSWDHREQPDLDELARLVLGMSGGRVFITPVEDTGSDEYAIVIADRDMIQHTARQAYLDHLRRD